MLSGSARPRPTGRITVGVSRAPPGPVDDEERRTIEAMARSVAQRGASFEAEMRSRGDFPFLEPSERFHGFYAFLLEQECERRSQAQSQSQAAQNGDGVAGALRLLRDGDEGGPAALRAALDLRPEAAADALLAVARASAEDAALLARALGELWARGGRSKLFVAPHVGTVVRAGLAADPTLAEAARAWEVPGAPELGVPARGTLVAELGGGALADAIRRENRGPRHRLSSRAARHAMEAADAADPRAVQLIVEDLAVQAPSLLGVGRSAEADRVDSPPRGGRRRSRSRSPPRSVIRRPGAASSDDAEYEAFRRSRGSAVRQQFQAFNQRLDEEHRRRAGIR